MARCVCQPAVPHTVDLERCLQPDDLVAELCGSHAQCRSVWDRFVLVDLDIEIEDVEAFLRR